MYGMYFQRHNLKMVELRLETTPHGLRTWQVKLSPLAAGFVSQEAGIHRIVHLAQGRRQTSFAAVEVEALYESLKLQIPDREIKTETLRGSGPGGQHRNKVETAVRLTHIPSGIQAYAATRSQADNRQMAMEVLKSRVQKWHEKGKPAKERSQEASFGSQKRSYRLHGRCQEVVDHATGKKADTLAILERGRLELLQ